MEYLIWHLLAKDKTNISLDMDIIRMQCGRRKGGRAMENDMEEKVRWLDIEK